MPRHPGPGGRPKPRPKPVKKPKRWLKQLAVFSVLLAVGGCACGTGGVATLTPYPNDNKEDHVGPAPGTATGESSGTGGNTATNSGNASSTGANGSSGTSSASKGDKDKGHGNDHDFQDDENPGKKYSKNGKHK